MINNYDKLLQDIEASGQYWSDFDRELARQNPDAGRTIFQQKQKWASATTDAERQAANRAAEAVRAQFGSYTGGMDGSEFNGIFKPQVNKTPAYQAPTPKPVTPNYAPQYQEYASKYSDKINGLLDKIMGREEFSYDPTKDVNYQAIAETSRQNASRARQNAMGDAMMMTGGNLNSAAIAAGQLAENDANRQLTDNIPALVQAAYSMYQGDLAQDRMDLDALMGLDREGYNRHKDTYNANFGKWQADYGVDRDILNDQRLEEQQAYDRWRDQVGDDRYETEQEYERAWKKAQLLLAAGDASGFVALGYTPQEIDRLAAAAAPKPGRGPARDDDEDEFLDLDLGNMTQNDIQKWVKNMLDNGTSSQFNPQAVIQGTNQLTGDQKQVANAILDEYIKAGYMKYPHRK